MHAAAARRARVVERASELGFDAVGVTRADVPLEVEHARYRAFLEAGFHGEMAYLEEAAEARRRLDTADILEGARSVVCVARRYDRPAAEERDPPLARSIARYARGQDYHNGLRKKLRRLAAFCRELAAEGEVIRARPLLDEEPVLERAWAARAGLGFVGKNGLLIVPGRGSYVLLGEVVTTAEIEPDGPIAERCGACTRCLDACPTGAFPRPFVLDARRCVAYLTIELRGAVPDELKAGVGDHLFGCDVCQEVCPFNGGKRPDTTARMFEPHARWGATSLVDVLSADDARFAELAAGSPIHRATRAGFARSAALVLGHVGDPAAAPALARAAAEDPSAAVREAAAWALSRLSTERA
jgi:epoxyqueuosine reductase